MCGKTLLGEQQIANAPPAEADGPYTPIPLSVGGKMLYGEDEGGYDGAEPLPDDLEDDADEIVEEATEQAQQGFALSADAQRLGDLAERLGYVLEDAEAWKPGTGAELVVETVLFSAYGGDMAKIAAFFARAIVRAAKVAELVQQQAADKQEVA